MSYALVTTGDLITAAMWNGIESGFVETSGDTMTGALIVEDVGAAFRSRIEHTAPDVDEWRVHHGVSGGRGSGLLRLFHGGVEVATLTARDDEWTFANPVKIGSADVARIATGTYTGNGGSNRLISTPFDPKFVYAAAQGSTSPDRISAFSGPDGDRGLFGTSMGTTDSSGSSNWGQWAAPVYRPGLDTGGFRVSADGSNVSMNKNSLAYDYVAIG